VGDDIRVPLAAQKFGKLFMDISATIETSIDDNDLLADIAAEDLFKHGAHSPIVH